LPTSDPSLFTFPEHGTLALGEVGELLWNSQTDLVGVLGADQRLHRANRAWAPVLGYGEADLRAMDPMQLVHPDDLPVALTRIEDLVAGRERHGPVELRVRRRTGDWAWVTFSATRMRGGDSVFIVGRDVTELHLAQEELTLRAALHDLVLTSIPAAFFRLELAQANAAVSFAWMSGQARQVTGFEAEAFLAESTLWWDRIHPEDRARMAGDASRLTDEGTLAREYRWLHADGRWRWFFGYVRFLVTGAAQAGVVGMMMDVTERKQADDSLRDLAARLERSNQDLQQFAQVASHDLREPLRMVASYVTLLADRYQGRLDADADDFIAFAVDGARRGQQLIDGLLTYSRVQLRVQPPAPVDAGEALQAALDALAQVITEAGATVTAEPLPAVLADASLLAQVFQNLVGNAVKYRGALPPRVHVQAQGEGRFVRFSVRDNGIGIDPRHHQRIFQLFQRLHGPGEYPGTGLGLAICKRIVEGQPGARLWVESAPGAGATFHFTLPRVESEPCAAPAQKGPDAAADP
jgi:PAS domain S-box-containing protein